MLTAFFYAAGCRLLRFIDRIIPLKGPPCRLTANSYLDNLLKRTGSPTTCKVLMNLSKNNTSPDAKPLIIMENTPFVRRSFIKAMTLGTTGVVLGNARSFANSFPYPITTSTVTESFLPTWERAKDYTLEFAEAMPADKYSFKPVPEVFSFAEQLLHIAQATTWICTSYISNDTPPRMNFQAEGQSKEDVIKVVTEMFDFVAGALAKVTDEQAEENVETFAGQMKRKQALLLMRDHVTHHRGQMVVYVRLNGIVPPEYVGH